MKTIVRLVKKMLKIIKLIPLRSKPIPELQHLPFSFIRAISEVKKNVDVNMKIKKGYFKDRLVVVPALPKAASSVISTCIAEIQSRSGIDKKRGYARYMLHNQDSDLRPELVLDFSEGGVLKFHTKASDKNLKVLEILGVKYVILFRNPIDQIAAAYCDIINFSHLEEAAEKNNWLVNHMFPMDPKKFVPPAKQNDSINYMLSGGYLYTVLMWMVDWMRFRDQKKSIIVKYEDFVRERNETLAEISLFLNGTNIEGDCLKECKIIADRYASRRKNSDHARFYPKGWTGKIGAWKDYFSEDNRQNYLSVIKGFCEYYPQASLLVDIYPELLYVNV